MTLPSGRGNAKLHLVWVASLLTFLGSGCSSGKRGVEDLARVDACVLTGATTNDGCDLATGGGPEIRLGDLTMGAFKTRDLALYNGAAGQVAATLSDVHLEGASANYAILKIFRLDAASNEVPVTLPFDLAVNHGSELRVRVAFTANVAIGAVNGAAVRVVATHPASSLAIPIAGQVTGCPAGKGDCDGDPSNGCEVDLQTDLVHCGACATSCGQTNATATCQAGTCQITCAAGFGNCDGNAANGCETDLNADPAHCSACGTACDATNGTPSCTAGVCGIACAAGFADCDGNPANGCEVTLATDVAHCGACGTACSANHGTPACSNGLCTTACDAGYADCDGSAANGCEAQLSSDPAHCGTCGTACNGTNGTATCTAGGCGITCAAGFADCDGSLANGCEVNLSTSPAHCGSCSTACNATNGTATCAAGTCGITCNTGYADCDGNAGNGCEVNLAGDVANCGRCGQACNSTNGTATCTAGTCGITCAAGYGNCDGNAGNGCEVNLTSDTAHCGSCATACGTANATASCTAGACGLSCAAGYADCDGSNANGCEVSLLLDAANCGGCGLACSPPNAAGACAAGTCTVGTCGAGWADCNGLVGDGCEVALGTDVNNCGGCNNVCSLANATPACASGLCQVASCSAGWADCDGNPANGCEMDVNTSVANCGKCGAACTTANGTPACSAGSCATGACNAGWGDCDGNPANGCEHDVTSDPANCGGCGLVCALPNASSTCASSACQLVACSPGWFDMDGLATDGCECAADTNADVCAAPTALGAVNLGQTLTVTGNILPLSRSEYFTVTFPSNASMTYHPKIAVTSPSGIARFDVLSDCAGTAAGGCGTEGGTSLALTNWETYYAGGDPNAYWGAFLPVPPPGNAGTVIVRVYASGSTTTCGSFTLTVSN